MTAPPGPELAWDLSRDAAAPAADEAALAGLRVTVEYRDGAPAVVRARVAPPRRETRLLLAALEEAHGCWLRWDDRWLTFQGERVRSLARAAAQPTHRIRFDPAAGAPRTWLVLVDAATDAPDTAFAWTHEEWDADDDAPGAWVMAGGVWRHRCEATPWGRPGAVAVAALPPRAPT